MDDQAARSPGDQYIVSKPTTFSSPAVTTERELHPNEVFLDSTSILLYVVASNFKPIV